MLTDIPQMQIFVPSQEAQSFLQQFGFPVTISIIMLAIVFYMLKRYDKRQTEHDERYAGLVDKIFEHINAVSDKQTNTSNTLIERLNNLSYEMKIVGIKIDENTKIIDKELEVRRKTMVFPQERQSHRDKNESIELGTEYRRDE